MHLHRTETPRRRTPRRARPRLELLEDRLALSWAGVPPTTISVPASPVAVTLNTSGDVQGTASITNNEVDFYTFVAPRSGSYVFQATTPSSNLDTVLGIFSATGSRLAFNDDISSSNLDSRVSLNLTAGSRYFFGITNYTGTAGGSYTYAVDGPAASTDDGFEENDTRTTAADLGTLSARRTINNLVVGDAADWFRFTTVGAGTTAHTVTVTFQHSQGDIDLELYNSSGQLLRRSDSVSNTEQVTLDGLATGTYFVRVYGYQGALNPNYTLDIVPPTNAPPPPPPPTGSFRIELTLTGLSASQATIFTQAANRWAQVITGDLPDATYNGRPVDDLLIDASAVAIDGPGRILGQAGPDRVRSGSMLPIHGVMQFDSADLAQLEANGQLYDVILHEMGHVLGIGTIWQGRGLLSGAGTTNPRFLGAQATAAYNQIFGRNETSVPVEGLPSGPGSRDGHWRESVFGNELMSPFISGRPNPLSRVTAASLADLGYVVNLAAADNFTPPAGAASVAAPGGGTTGGMGLVAADGQPNRCCCPSCQSAAAMNEIPLVIDPGTATPSGQDLSLAASRVHQAPGGLGAVDAAYRGLSDEEEPTATGTELRAEERDTDIVFAFRTGRRTQHAAGGFELDAWEPGLALA